MNKLPDIVIDNKIYRHITQFKEKADSLRIKIWRIKQKGKKSKVIKLPAGYWLEVGIVKK